MICVEIGTVIFLSSSPSSHNINLLGRDDLRQDTVMQQIFLLVNVLLRKRRETRERNLNIRTYKVIPLTKMSGLLEWVENTTSLATYLIGTRKNSYASAHHRYRPDDWSSTVCTEKLLDARKKGLFQTYTEVMKNFKPVFHHFFLENFSDPAMWFAKRLAYTRSVACNSMIGYIVGLGDRHCDNILIDKSSCEVVHIDLGIAFEQGKTLRIPELVPFRLTRDIVDGMGVTGVEGSFRKCCEETMKVLRMNREFVLTIVEVFIHDPLFCWTPLVALKAQREIQEDMEFDEDWCAEGRPFEAQNKDAERTMLRIQAKLQVELFFILFQVGCI